MRAVKCCVCLQWGAGWNLPWFVLFEMKLNVILEEVALTCRGEFLWLLGLMVRYGCVFPFSSVLRAPLTLFPLHVVGRAELLLLLSAHPSPLKSHLRKVLIIKSCASGLQQVTCKEQDFFFFLPLTINWIYSLFNKCLPLKPDVFHASKWDSGTGEYQCLLLSCVVCVDCMDIVLFIISWRWEEISEVRQVWMCGHLSWVVFLLPQSCPVSCSLQGLRCFMELKFLFMECLTLVIWELNCCNLTETLDWT